MKKEGKPKFKKEKGEQAKPAEPLPPPPAEQESLPPPPLRTPRRRNLPAIRTPAPTNEGKPKHKKDKGKPQQETCPEGMVPLEDGSCVTPQ